MSSIGHNGDPDEDRASNWFAVSRDIFDHPIVGIHGRSFTDMEAWLWLVARASYETRRAMNKGAIVILDPGDLMAAHGYLSERWQWTNDKVRWFLKRLQSEAMISKAICNRANRTTNQIQIISICNYSRYQIIREAEHQAKPQANTRPTPGQHHEDNTLTTKQEDSPLPPEGVLPPSPSEVSKPTISGKEIARQAFREWQDFAPRHGLSRPKDTTFETFAKAIFARMREHADAQTSDGLIAVWRLAMANVARSKFLRGMGNAEFRADIAMITRPKNFAKLISGGYGNGAHAPQPETTEKSEYDIELEALQRQTREASDRLKAERLGGGDG